MNEAETGAEHIHPALKAAGWGIVEAKAEEQKLSRDERKALIKERRKTTSQKSQPSSALYNLKDDIGEKTTGSPNTPKSARG